MRENRFQGSIFSLILSALIALFLVIDLDAGSGPAKARGLAVVQHALRWLLVEPLGMFGAVSLVLAIGIGCALLVRPTG